MTLALPKTGLRPGDAENHAGELYLADIGVPSALYEEMGIDGPWAVHARGHYEAALVASHASSWYIPSVLAWRHLA